MDDQNKNLLLATALSFVVILVWFLVFPPPEPVPAPETPATQQTATGQPVAGSQQIELAEYSRQLFLVEIGVHY